MITLFTVKGVVKRDENCVSDPSAEDLKYAKILRGFLVQQKMDSFDAKLAFAF